MTPLAHADADAIESRAGWEAATKHMPTQKDMRTIWSIGAIFSGVFLALSLSALVPEVLAKSPHALDWAGWTVTFSIWLSVTLYARRPEYYEKYYEARLRSWTERYRKSRAERIRAACVFAGVAAGLLGLVFGGPILVGMVLWPGQSWGAYLVRATFRLSGEPRLDSGQLALGPGLESLEMFRGLPRVSLPKQPLFVFGQILDLEEFRQMRLRSLDLFPVHAKLIQERDRLLACLGDGSLS